MVAGPLCHVLVDLGGVFQPVSSGTAYSGQLYSVSMVISADATITGDDIRDGCGDFSKSSKKHGGSAKFGSLEGDGGNITLGDAFLNKAEMGLRVGKDENSGQLHLFFAYRTDRTQYETKLFPVTITSSGGSITLVLDPSVDVGADSGIQVEVFKTNKKKKGQQVQQVVGQITIRDAEFNAVPSGGTCDPNDP